MPTSSPVRTTPQPQGEAERVAHVLSALADSTRLRIVNLLAGGELCVCDVVELLDLPQSTVSRHLAVLRDQEIVEVERRGRFAHYRLRDPRLTVEAVLEALARRPQLAAERERASRQSSARAVEPCEV